MSLRRTKIKIASQARNIPETLVQNCHESLGSLALPALKIRRTAS
jgi:hypothetical protein